MKKDAVWNMRRPTGKSRAPQYTLDELAESLNQSRNALVRLASKYKIAPAFYGRPYRYERADFQRALNEEAKGTVYKVDKHIPLPTKIRGPSAASLLMDERLKGMSPGDSFSYEDDDHPVIYKSAQRLGIKIATRQDGFRRRVWVLEKPASN